MAIVTFIKCIFDKRMLYISVIGIMCSVCDTSGEDLSCISNPPPAENCTSCIKYDADSICQLVVDYKNCMIAKKYDVNGMWVLVVYIYTLNLLK